MLQIAKLICIMSAIHMEAASNFSGCDDYVRAMPSIINLARGACLREDVILCHRGDPHILTC